MVQMRWCLVLCSLVFSLLMNQAIAQQQASKDYPNKPIRVIVPYAAGGPMDFIGRFLAQKLSPVFGPNMILDNKPGAGGAIGTEIVAKSSPDGYTILNTSSSHASLPVVSKSLGYDPVKDFQPITLIANSVGFIVAVRGDFPAKNLQEFLLEAKANPGKYNYGSGGVGNVMQFAAEFFNTSAGIKLQHVPFKGVGQAITELLAGRIDVVIGPGVVLAPHLKSGRIKAFAITAKKRWVEFPDLPTTEEAGLKGFTYIPFYGYWYPAGVPKEYVVRMRNEIAKVLEQPDAKKAFLDQGFDVVGSTPEEFARIVTSEIELNRKLAQTIDFSEN